MGLCPKVEFRIVCVVLQNVSLHITQVVVVDIAGRVVVQKIIHTYQGILPMVRQRVQPVALTINWARGLMGPSVVKLHHLLTPVWFIITCGNVTNSSVNITTTN